MVIIYRCIILIVMFLSPVLIIVACCSDCKTFWLIKYLLYDHFKTMLLLCFALIGKCRHFSDVCVGLCLILTHLAYIASGKKTCYIVQQFHWANKRDVTLRHL